MNKIYPQTFSLAVFIYALLFLLTPEKGLQYDMDCWASWSAFIFEHGLGNAYASGTNYLPGHLIEMKLYTLLWRTKEEVINHIYYLKYFTLLFDVAGALLVASFSKEKRNQQLILLALLLNIAFIHNTVAWGQFDSVFSFFSFASFIAIYRRRYVFGLLLFLVALNFKLQAIIFLPALVMLMLYHWDFKLRFKTLASTIAILIFAQSILLIPFILTSSTGKVFATLHGLAGQYSYISLNAANIWQLLLAGDLRWTSNQNTFLDVTYKSWGFLMYSAAIIFALLPVAIDIFGRYKGKSSSLNLKYLLLTFILSALIFFYFHTEMHERYSYPGFIFIAAFCVLSGHWWIYALFSTAYFLNVDQMLHSSNLINYYTWVFSFKFIASVFAVIIVTCYFLLYQKRELLIKSDL